MSINSLADSRMESSARLEFKQRLSIALGAAKGESNRFIWRGHARLTQESFKNKGKLCLSCAGLCHLHGLKPPLVHRNFKTANVLVDENFIAKVADAGVWKLLQRIEEGGPSCTASVTVFQDPEYESISLKNCINFFLVAEKNSLDHLLS